MTASVDIDPTYQRFLVGPRLPAPRTYTAASPAVASPSLSEILAASAEAASSVVNASNGVDGTASMSGHSVVVAAPAVGRADEAPYGPVGP